ncbi:phthiocerol/phthiodiolone dimycocerosyl transferase family protein [Phytohabitans sp. LJ34]|uniref:phthiocerol/phthiodiolone dimycocerosyl transferase family protein n=1 Tax=Phytohabitans sp. LJ34 TaxID=3452217 RepID=UPI003F8A12EC
MNGFAWVQVRGRLVPEQLAWAAAAVVAEQPLLRVSIHAKPDGTDPRFEPATGPVMPIRIVHADADDEQAAERELDTREMREPVDTTTAPMARLVDVVRGAGTDAETHDLILTMSHTIVDATARVGMLAQLLRYAAEWDPNSDEPRRVVSREPVPPIGYALPRGVRGLGRAIATVFTEHMASLRAHTKPMAPERHVPPADKRTRLLLRKLSGDQLDALLSTCRRRGVTVHAALSTATARAVGREIGITNGKVTIRTPVQARAELSPPLTKSDVGNYMCVTQTYVNVDPNADFWAVARQFNKDLRKRLRLRAHLSSIALMRKFAPKSLATSTRFVDGIDDRAAGAVLVSNLGRVDFPDRVGDWELSAVQFFSTMSVTGQMAICAVTSNGVLHLNTCYVEGQSSAERAARVTDDTLAILMAAVGRG